jgi:hypothetical protein
MHIPAMQMGDLQLKTGPALRVVRGKPASIWA